MNAGLLQNAVVGPLARMPGRRHAVYPPHCTKSARAFVTPIGMAATKSRLRRAGLADLQQQLAAYAASS
ncbi:hypothetical protein ACJBUE_21455 (plasmid) [Ralstonia syzygii subsp. celebesensis]|uniref:hypothetical protein n=1 Tax=Ralstonia syzygii TaxID=28097 RepID=UPI00387E0F92